MKKSIFKPVLLTAVLLGGIFSQTAGLYQGNQQIASVKADEVEQGDDIKTPEPFVTIHDEIIHFHSVNDFQRKITDVHFVVRSYCIDNDQQVDHDNNQLYDGARPNYERQYKEDDGDRKLDTEINFRLGRHNTSGNTNWLANEAKNAVLTGKDTNIDKVNFAMKGTLTCYIDGEAAEFENVIIAQRWSQNAYNRWMVGQQNCITDAENNKLCIMHGTYPWLAKDPNKTEEENEQAQTAILMVGLDEEATRDMWKNVLAACLTIVIGVGVGTILAPVAAPVLVGTLIAAGLVIACMSVVQAILDSKELSNNFIIG